MRALLIMMLAVAACRTRELPPPPPPVVTPDLASPDLTPPPARNACGGSATLSADHAQGDACGPCGFWVCDTDGNALHCSDQSALNACGKCGPVPKEVCNGFDDDCDGVIDPGCPHNVETTDGYEDRVRLANGRIATEAQVYQGSDLVPLTRVLTLPDATVLESLKGASGSDLSADYLVVAGAVSAYRLSDGALLAGPPAVYMGSPVLDGEDVFYASTISYGTTTSAVRVWHIGDADVSDLVTLPDYAHRPVEVAVTPGWLAFTTAQDLGRLFLYDRAQATTIEIAAELGGSNSSLALDGNRLAWQHLDTTTMVTAVYTYDIDAAKLTRIELDNAAAPRLSGDLMCFAIEPYQNAMTGGLYVYDFSTRKTTRVLPFGDSCDIDGKRLAYVYAEWTPDAFYVDLIAGMY